MGPQFPQREHAHSPTVIARDTEPFIGFLGCFPIPVFLFTSSWCFLHLPNNYCTQVLILGSAFGGTHLRHMAKLYLSLASLPDSSASQL